MATNNVFDGWRRAVTVTHPTTPASGDPVRWGPLTGVALTDEGEGGNSATQTSVDFGPSTWDLSVKAIDDAGNSAVAEGDLIYYVDADTPKLSKKSSGYLFGVAQEAITAGSTATIRVMHLPVVAAGAAIGSEALEPSIRQRAVVRLTNAQILALRATPITLVAAPGANKVTIVEDVYMVLDAAAGAYTETADNLAVEYADGTDILTIETTGFVDQASVELRAVARPEALAEPIANSAVRLFNSGDGEFGGGNAANTLSVAVIYRVESAVAFTV